MSEAEEFKKMMHESLAKAADKIISELRAENKQLKAERDKYKDALKIYADKGRWMKNGGLAVFWGCSDGTVIARKALEVSDE